MLREAFSPAHLPMALYFTLIGTAVGVAYGVYHTRISRLYEEVKHLSVTDPCDLKLEAGLPHSSGCRPRQSVPSWDGYR